MRYYIKRKDIEKLDLGDEVVLLNEHGKECTDKNGYILLHLGNGDLYIYNMSGSGESIWFTKAYVDGNIINCIYSSNGYCQELRIGILNDDIKKVWINKNEE